MTRINTIDPSLLSNKHLNAEYRELPRVFDLVRQANIRGEQPSDKRNPKQYTMGAGHVRFFYNKLGYLVDRQLAIIAEKDKRGMESNYRDVYFLIEGIPSCWLGDWQPSENDRSVNITRLLERDYEFYKHLKTF